MAWKPYEEAEAFTLLVKAAISVTLLSTCSKKLSDLETSITSPFSHAWLAVIFWFNNSIDSPCKKQSWLKKSFSVQ